MSDEPLARTRKLYFVEILREELSRLFPKPENPAGGENLPEAEQFFLKPGNSATIPANENNAGDLVNDLYKQMDRDLPPLAALCLSGGGIRSASFALGALQALAQFGLLGQFHYLSTVSGGGYIGGWLSAWRHHANNDQAVFQNLNALQRTGDEAAEIRGIRADSNYLTPRLGLFSADTWTVIALYVRNLLLNWLVFGPFFLGVLFIPRVVRNFIKTAQQHYDLAQSDDLLTVGGIAIVLGLTVSNYGRFRAEGKWLTNNRFLLLSVSPVLAGAVCFSLATAIKVAKGPLQGWDFTRDFQTRGILAGVLVYGLSWVLARLAIKVSYRNFTLGFLASIGDFVAWLAGGGVAGVILFLGLYLAQSRHPGPDLLTILGFACPVAACLSGELLYVGLSSLSPRGDMDREWLARSAGWLTALSAAWAISASICLYGPRELRLGGAWLSGLGGLSGVVTLLLGQSAKTAAVDSWKAISNLPLLRIVSIAAVLFGVFLASILSLADHQLDRWLYWHNRSAHIPLLGGFTPAIVLIALSVLVSRFINVNRFSLHALYRNRLVRAFLGSARATAHPPRLKTADPFTGFDLKDNVAMAELVGSDVTKPVRLLHVVNMALNVVSSRNLAWQERKAESFTVTPLASGNPNVGYRQTRIFGGVRTGLTLGTAVAISGAAVSPNQGYHSSPLVGFLLTLFNVRLGWWLGNPKFESYKKEAPTIGLFPALQELAGATTDDGHWVYMSDGGHFENLGLYEMVRRRCRVIVLSDAGSDPNCAFEDLGNAVRKAFVDMGVSINFTKLEIKARQNPPVGGVYCAVGRICYPGSSIPGWLIYVKPGYHGTEPADVRSYAQAHETFPHESTADQFFSESQLESYRALGAHIFEQILTNGSGVRPDKPPSHLDINEIVSRVAAYLGTTVEEMETS